MQEEDGRKRIVKEVRHLSLTEKPGRWRREKRQREEQTDGQGLRGGIPRVEETWWWEGQRGLARGV